MHLTGRLHEHKYLGPIVEHLASLDDVAKIKSTLSRYHGINEECWEREYMKWRIRVHEEENPNSRMNLTLRLQKLKQKKEHLILQYKQVSEACQKTKESMRKQKFQRCIQKRIHEVSTDLSEDAQKTINFLKEHNYQLYGSEPKANFSSNSVSTLSLETGSLVSCVAQKTVKMLGVSKRSELEGSFDLRWLLEKYPLSHILWSLANHMRQINVRWDQSAYATPKKVSQAAKLKFDSLEPSAPWSTQRIATSLAHLFTSHSSCDEFKQFLHSIPVFEQQEKFKQDRLPLGALFDLSAKVQDRLDEIVSEFEEFSKSSLSQKFDELSFELQLCERELRDFISSRFKLDFSPLFYLPSSYNIPKVGKVDALSLEVFKLEYERQHYEKVDQLLKEIKSSYEHVASPNLELLLSNLKAHLAGYFKIVDRDQQPKLEEAKAVLDSGFKEKLKELRQLQLDCERIYSIEFLHRLSLHYKKFI